MAEFTIDIIFVSITIFIYAAYHTLLAWRVSKRPMSTSIGCNSYLRKIWVHTVTSRPGQEVLVIQTLRNLVMGSSLMASTSMLLVVLLINALVAVNTQNGLFGVIKVFGTSNHDFNAAKILSVIIVFFISFFNHAACIRYIIHVGFAINATTGPRSVDFCAAQLLKGSRHFTWGQRSFYLSLPLLLWLFDPLFMLIGMCFLVIALYDMDLNINEDHLFTDVEAGDQVRELQTKTTPATEENATPTTTTRRSTERGAPTQ
jgi:uncharacterized membrane protein